METLIDPQTLVELHLQLWLPKKRLGTSPHRTSPRGLSASRPCAASFRFVFRCFFLPKKKWEMADFGASWLGTFLISKHILQTITWQSLVDTHWLISKTYILQRCLSRIQVLRSWCIMRWESDACGSVNVPIFWVWVRDLSTTSEIQSAISHPISDIFGQKIDPPMWTLRITQFFL